MRLLLLLDTLVTIVLLPACWRVRRAFAGWVAVPQEKTTAADVTLSVSVLVPARNEAGTIERCIHSLLAQAYPPARMRLIVVDDQSTDDTARVLDCLRDPRLTIVRGEPLQPGWTGKNWALHQATQRVDPTCEWLLFTDADTVHAPLALSSAICFATRHRLDLLSLGTGQDLVSLPEKLLLPFILGLALTINGTLEQVNDPSATTIAKANGQYLLIRTQTYAALGGHAALGAARVEDFELARRVKRYGGRVMLADGRHLVRTRAYRSLREIWWGFTKNALDEARRQPLGLLIVPIVTIGPHLLVGWVLPRVLRSPRRLPTILLTQAILQSIAVLGVGRECATACELPAVFGLAEPLASLFLFAVVLHAGCRRALGLGVNWKGRTLDLT
ncbi:MAG: glycosyltransferase [Chloroflexi bacterium]|nr:glycosyltransferase [Chloroflexota bacterium]